MEVIPMRVELLKILGTWRDVANAARTTIGQEAGEGEPSSKWKRRMLLAEHSPIRKIHISWKWRNLMSWVSVHFVRHKYGIEHFVSTARPDRTGIPRGSKEDHVDHECESNPAEIIYISRKRLCKKAEVDTRIAWTTFLETLAFTEPELFLACVPDCIYRGWCYEYGSCGDHLKPQFQIDLDKYRRNINGWEEKNG